MNKVDIPQVSGVFAAPWSLKKLWGLLSVFGPAAIVASVSIGAGETIVVVRAGAWAGYDLLWLVLLSCVVKGVFVTYLLGRYTAISGEHIGHRLVHLPGPSGWLPLSLVAFEMLGAPLAWVAIAKPCGDLFHFLFSAMLPSSIPPPIWGNLITSCFIALALFLGLRLSFERLEKQQLLICCILVIGTTIGTLMVRPGFWQAVFRKPQLRLFAPVSLLGPRGCDQTSNADDGDNFRICGRWGDVIHCLCQLGGASSLGFNRSQAYR